MNLGQMLVAVKDKQHHNPDKHGIFLTNPHEYAGYAIEVAFEDESVNGSDEYISIEEFIDNIECAIQVFHEDTPVHIAKKNCHGVELTGYRLNEVLR